MVYGWYCVSPPCDSHWDHVGVVVTLGNGNGLYTLESDAHGVDLYPITEQSLRAYPGDIAVRRVKGLGSGDQTNLADKMHDYAREVRQRGRLRL